MKRLMMALCVLSVVALACGVYAADPAPPKPAAAPKAPFVYSPYGKLNLTDDQKTKISAIQADSNAKIKALRDEEQKKIDAVLTDDQKAQLKKMNEEQAAALRERAKALREKLKSTPPAPPAPPAKPQ